jgi:DNA gyrase/topoisomerase IV subunit A
MKNEIIIYQSDELTERIEVKLEDETVWLNQEQMALLFKQTKQNISLHINNCFKENELDRNSTVKEYLTVQNEGRRKIQRRINLYNLDVVISVGYRVKSKQGTQFRIWANQVLKDFLIKGYAVNNRMNRLEDNIETLKDKVQYIDLQIQSKLIPTQGIFFEGQVFDAYELTSRIIRSAKKSIVLIDNYIEESTLVHLSKKEKNVGVTLLSKDKSAQFDLDLKKANAQYGNFAWQQFDKSHDRFLIIDQNEVYHLGASLKDLGKKWFAFSKLDVLWLDSLLQEINFIKTE